MKGNWDDKLIGAFYCVFGGVLGFLIFMMALGGWRFVFLGHASHSWNGLLALLLCVGIGGGWGLVSYKYRDREFGGGPSRFYDDPASARLFTKRLMVIATCVAGLYFIWQLAKGL
jgi:hypothetical protein